jgi:hypothetical protein
MEVIKRTVCNTVLACLREEEADMASIYSWGSKQVFENYHVAHQIFADYWEYLNIMNLDANVPLEAQDVRVRLRLGEVIRNILFLNQSYFDNIQVLFTRMRRTITDLTEMTEHIGKTAVECISGTSLVSQKCVSPMGISNCDPDDLKKLKQCVNSFLEGLQQLIHVTGMDELLGQLLISLCLNRGYMKAYAKVRKLQLTVQ